MSEQIGTSGTKDNEGRVIDEIEVGAEEEITNESSDENEEGEDNEAVIDFETGGSDCSENSQSDNDLSELEDKEPSLIVENVVAAEQESCSCCHFDNLLSALCFLDENVNSDFTTDSIDCLIDNIIRAVKHIFENDNSMSSPYKVAVVDLFYRIRHEIIFKMLCMSYNLPLTKSDQPFSDYNIESKRTPDLIIKIEGVIYIIEVTAVGSLERGAQSKGVESLGFESKYKREMTLLNEEGHSVRYLPVVFNMNDPNSPADFSQLDELGTVFIKSKTNFIFMLSKVKKFALFSTEIKGLLLLPSTQLFSKMVPIKKQHKSHEFLYEISNLSNVKWQYKEMNIQPSIYHKINRDWSRFYGIIESRGYTDDTKVVPIINLSTGRVDLEKSNSGVRVDKLVEWINQGNKIEFFKVLKTKVAGGRNLDPVSEKGVKITFRAPVKAESKTSKRSLENICVFSDHKTALYCKSDFDINKYNTYVDNDESIYLNFKYYDNDYEDLLLDKMRWFDTTESGSFKQLKEIGLLGTTDAASIDIDSVMNSVRENYIALNTPTEQIPLIKLKMKQPFILPIANIDSRDYSSLNFKNSDLIRSVIENLGNNNYTIKVLNTVLSDSFKLHKGNKAPSASLIDLKNQRIKLSNEINKLQKELYKANPADGNVRLSKTTDPKFSSSFQSLKGKLAMINKAIKDRSSIEGVSNDISFVRLPSKGKSLMSKEYRDEMSHFRDKKVQATTEGVGIRSNPLSDFNKDKEVFNSINEALTTYCGVNPDPLLDDYVAPDSSLLRDLKKAALDRYKNIMKEVTSSRLGHAAALISRLSHSLMFYSQLSFNSDYIRVDNLGYKNVLLIVKGGKKIFKSKSSKLFRLICPILPETLPWYQEGHLDKGSFIIFPHSGLNFLITPWMMLHESVLTDSISFYPRVCSFAVLNLNHNLELSLQYNRIALNILLAFHNRRQTEVLLANMRYILLSTLGDFTGVTDIIKEFFSFNYDCFQAFVRSCILYNYPNYFKQLISLKRGKGHNKEINSSDFENLGLENIFTGRVIKKVEDLTLMIYSTFLMTKAPYQRSIERANNLKGILKIHQLYDQGIGLNLTPKQQYDKISVVCTNDQSYMDYTEKLFDNDFNFDPKYCALLGTFIDSEFINKGLKDDIFNKWYSILNSSWDEMATSTGLRGDYADVENFWGQKGYFVVYKDLLSSRDFNEVLQSLLFSTKTDNEKRTLLRRLNTSFIDKIDDDRSFLIFHAVDKVQWKGGREIYVMDMFTKTVQQPIEKFMGYICKLLDNELISIPSDKRSQVIHHSIFEKDLPLKDSLTWYLTLDCTKWAPKSIFVKFISAILPISSIPNSFKYHFLNYSEKLFFKRIYFNTKEVEVLLNNSQYKSICEKYLKHDKTVNGYYLLMPYSWVMGIFNYTSSFLHAANQKYCSHLINLNSIETFGEETALFMFAHSDDSGGRLTTSSIGMAQRALIIYEINLKACNHLLSKKKSVVSRIYFEILSIIYLFKRLMALLPKFLGGLRFLPTDKGPCQDMSQSYSKCIEVIIAGANFSIAYIVLKIYSMLVWRFYYNQTPVKSDYNRPVQYMGMPDAHPLMVTLCGSEADIIRIFKTERLSLERVYKFSNRIMQMIEEPSPIKPFKFSIKVKNIKRGFEEPLEIYKEALDSWSIRNVNYHNSGMNCLNFLNKLRDSGFVGSLVNESTTRRFSRGYFMRSQSSLMTNFGSMKISEALDCLRLFQGFLNEEDSVRMVLNNILPKTEIEDLIIDINSKNAELDVSLKVIEETCYSPLKMYKYMDQLSMEGRQIVTRYRTLKPTVLQLVKSTNIFSSRFDPPSLVSYIKEPEMRWALPDLRGLFTAESELNLFLDKRGFNINSLSPDNLLKICRDFGYNGTKTIYLYSGVPSELRQIKSYSAFLTYLSLNSFENQEITGLTIRLTGAEMSTGYTMTNINDDIYEINNIFSILIILFNKLDIDFFTNLNIREVLTLGWRGGDIKGFLQHINTVIQDDIHQCYFYPSIKYLNCIFNNDSKNAQDLNKGSYYTFLKAQRLNRGWYGKGEIYIMVEGTFYSLELYNNNIVFAVSNHSGKILQHHADYIKDVCDNVGVNLSKLSTVKRNDKMVNDCFFGYDLSGHLSIIPGREVSVGCACAVRSYRGGFVDELYNYNIVDLTSDVVTLRCDLYNEPIHKKLYTLPLKKPEILPQLRMLLDPTQFEIKLQTMGLETFEDFIYTEVLTEYGNETYIEFNELFDNYNSSMLFKVFNEVTNKSWSYIPKNPTYSNFPANEGSLTKILVDYSQNTGSMIIDVNKEINSTVMRIRSEYPEKMGVLLAEKMVEFYNEIYDKNIRREILDEYNKITQSEDHQVVRNSIIKLMTYWGYGGLVNAIQNFTMVRDQSNFQYFNYNIIIQGRSGQYTKTFTNLMNAIFSEITDWSSQYNSLDFPTHRLKNSMGASAIIINYIRYTCLSCYNFTTLDVMHDINVLQFHNLLLALLKDEDFCSSLQLRLSNDYLLGSLPISYKFREELIVLINTLRWIWCSAKKVNFNLSFIEKLQRLPNDIPNWKSLSRDFQQQIPPAFVYYHGAISSDSVNEIMRRCDSEIVTTRCRYRLSGKLAQPSSTLIPISNVLKFKRPLKSSVLETDDWEDLKIELDTDDPYIESVNECIENLGPIYAKKVTRVLSGEPKKVLATIRWVIYPMRSSCRPVTPMLRQVGENFVLVSTSFMPSLFKCFYNIKVRYIEYHKGEKMICYTSLQDELNNDEFVDRLLGTQRDLIQTTDLVNLYSGLARAQDGNIKSSLNAGTHMNSDLLTAKVQIVTVDNITKVIDKEKMNEAEVQLTEEQIDVNKKSEVYKCINNLKNQGLTKELCDRLQQKYLSLINDHKITTQVILKSISLEGELNLLNKALNEGSLKLSANEYKETFLAPKFNSMSYGTSGFSNKSIKNKSIKAELEAFHEEISSMVGSGLCLLSKSFKRVVDSNYKMWKNMAKSTNYKRENKTFMIAVFTTLLSCCKVVEETENDHVWQTILNKISLYITDDPDTDDDDDEDFMFHLKNIIPQSRLKYKVKGT